MAKGYPAKITRTSLGPTYVNTGKIGDPKKAADADAFNLLCWQTAGMNGSAARGLLLITGGGASSPAIANQWFAWDPNQALAPTTIVRLSTGTYTWSLPNAGFGVGIYPDMNGVNTSVGLFAALPSVQGTGSAGTVASAIAAVSAGGVTGTINSFNLAGAASDFSTLCLLLY
jgi:hypothetical protein